MHQFFRRRGYPDTVVDTVKNRAQQIDRQCLSPIYVTELRKSRERENSIQLIPPNPTPAYNQAFNQSLQNEPKTNRISQKTERFST